MNVLGLVLLNKKEEEEELGTRPPSLISGNYLFRLFDTVSLQCVVQETHFLTDLQHGEGLAGDVDNLKVAERQATHLTHLVQHVLSCNTYYTHKKENQIFLKIQYKEIQRERLHSHI
jgi:hypothetical protein